MAEREKVTKQASERKDKAQNDRALDNLLGDWNKEYNTGDRLAGFAGTKKDTKEGESDKDKKAKEKAAKQFEQLKEQAQKELNVILEKNMSEQELEQKRYNEQVASLDKHLKDKAINNKSSIYLESSLLTNKPIKKPLN